jgi:hypothetical protein
VTRWSCRREPEIGDARVSGRWTADLRQHVSTCAVCREVSRVGTALAAMPHVQAPAAVNPSLLWERARQARRLRAEAQISRIVTATQTATAAGVGIGAIIVCVRIWPASWQSLTLGVGDHAILSGATALLMVTALAVSRWLSHDA